MMGVLESAAFQTFLNILAWPSPSCGGANNLSWPA